MGSSSGGNIQTIGNPGNSIIQGLGQDIIQGIGNRGQNLRMGLGPVEIHPKFIEQEIKSSEGRKLLQFGWFSQGNVPGRKLLESSDGNDYSRWPEDGHSAGYGPLIGSNLGRKLLQSSSGGNESSRSSNRRHLGDPKVIRNLFQVVLFDTILFQFLIQ